MATNDPELENILRNFDLIRDLIVFIEEPDLALEPVINAGSFGKQFRHIADMRKCYTEALRDRKLDFVRHDIDHSVENSRESLMELLDSTARDFRDAFKAIDILREVDRIDGTAVTGYLGDRFAKVSPDTVLRLLSEHEVFHQGELALYLRASGIPFPHSWIAWGLR